MGAKDIKALGSPSWLFNIGIPSKPKIGRIFTSTVCDNVSFRKMRMRDNSCLLSKNSCYVSHHHWKVMRHSLSQAFSYETFEICIRHSLYVSAFAISDEARHMSSDQLVDLKTTGHSLHPISFHPISTFPSGRALLTLSGNRSICFLPRTYYTKLMNVDLLVDG